MLVNRRWLSDYLNVSFHLIEWQYPMQHFIIRYHRNIRAFRIIAVHCTDLMHFWKTVPKIWTTALTRPDSMTIYYTDKSLHSKSHEKQIILHKIIKTDILQNTCIHVYLSQHMRFWYSSYRRAGKAGVEPDEYLRSDQNLDLYPRWICQHGV